MITQPHREETHSDGHPPHPWHPQGDADRLHALTGLRFLAAAAVFVSHARLWFLIPDFEPGPLGSAAVGFFFTLSGFILSHVYHSRKTSRAQFYKARFARIWPLHATCLALVVITPGLAGPPQDAVEWTQFASHVTLTQSWTWDAPWFLKWNGPAWSLSVEAFFYVLFPFVAALRPRQAICAYALTFLATFAAYAIADHVAAGNPRAAEAWVTALSTVPPLRLQEFLAGICAYHIWANGPRLLAASSTASATLFEAFSVALVAANFMAWGSGSWGQAWMTFLNRPVAVEALSRGAGLTWAFGLLICVFAPGKGWLGKALSRPFAVYLGEISFAFYLVHAAVLSWGNAWAGARTGAWERPCLVSTLWSIGVSALLFALVETPARKAIMQPRNRSTDRWRTLRSAANQELARPQARFACMLGAAGCAIAWLSPMTAREHGVAAARASAPELRMRQVVGSCSLLGATTLVSRDAFECTAVIEGQTPDGTEIALLALTKEGVPVHSLELTTQQDYSDTTGSFRVLVGKSLFPPLTGSSVLELRVVRVGDPAKAPIGGSTSVELVRLPW